MDLTGAISNLQTNKTMGQIQIAVARRIMDSQRQQGDAALQLLQAATTGVTQAGDQLVAAATGLGGSLDTYA